MARVDCAWAAPQEYLLNPRPVAASHRLHTPDSSTGGLGAAFARRVAVVFVPRAPRGPGQGTGQTLEQFEHPRQPDESWASIHRGTGQWLAGRFFIHPRAIWMDLDDGPVQGYGFDLHADDLRLLQLCKYAIQHPALRPTNQARIAGCASCRMAWVNLASCPLLGDVQDGVEHVPIVEPHVAAWRRHTRLDVAILGVGDFNRRSIS